jgi:hypothetical protein
MVPENMKGSVLYPLSILKNNSVKAYKENLKRYSGRENVLEKLIPSLNCKWNDVIHLVAVHPAKITKALKEAGYDVQKLNWYKIPAKILNPKNSTIYLYKYKKDLSQVTALDQFTNISIKRLSKYSKVPKKTIQYYKKEIKEGRRPLRFHFIPHVLYKGEIDISNCEIINA